jgi:gliding motility-associated-like protein
VTFNAYVPQDAPVVADFDLTPETGQMPVQAVLTNNSTGANSYHWDFGNGKTSTLENPKNLYKEEGEFTITLIATRNQLCADTLSKIIKVTDYVQLTIPNVFSPNRDGNNDIFTFTAYGFSEFSCTIFNRWGEHVYSWDQEKGGWDGRSSAGVEVPDGVYYYILKAKDNDGNQIEERKGSITLVR